MSDENDNDSKQPITKEELEEALKRVGGPISHLARHVECLWRAIAVNSSIDDDEFRKRLEKV